MICPRKCGVNRNKKELGFCGQTDKITAAKAYLHAWEEPCISGKNGSGTVFFSGCNLQCVFCQNRQIATGEVSKEITKSALARYFWSFRTKRLQILIWSPRLTLFHLLFLLLKGPEMKG